MYADMCYGINTITMPQHFKGGQVRIIKYVCINDIFRVVLGFRVFTVWGRGCAWLCVVARDEKARR